MQVLWRLPGHLPGADKLLRRAMRLGVHVHTFASGGAREVSGTYAASSLLLGYSSLNGKEIKQGVAAIERAAGLLGAVRS